MDLHDYYAKIRETRQSLPEGTVVLVSLDTPDGGKAGVRLEMPAQVAARMLVDRQARRATEEEAREFEEQKMEAKRAADQLAATSRMQFTVVSASELRELKRPAKN